jgi:RNA polymerase sigma factor (sigma-70 family)
MSKEVTDEELIKGCLKGTAHYQRLLYQRFAAKMLTVCMRYAINREEAEDTLHEGFIVVFNRLHQFRMDGSFEGWIRKIMLNKAIDAFRKKSPMQTVVDIGDVSDEIAAPEDVLSTIGFNDLLRMVQELPPTYKMVFNLYVFEGMSHKEISDMLGTAVATSKSNLFNARALLKKKILKNLYIDDQTLQK